MRRFAEVVVALPKVLIGIWFVVLLAGAGLAQTTIDRLAVDFALPGQPGDTAGKAVVSTFGTAGEASSPLIVTLTVPEGQSVAEHRPQIAAMFEALSTARMFDTPLQVYHAGNSTDPSAFVTGDGRTALAYVFYPPPRTAVPVPPAQQLEPLRESLPAGWELGLTGRDALAVGEGSDIGVGVMLELVIASVGALLVLAYVFGSFLAVLPLLTAMVSIPAALLLLLPMTYAADISFVVQYLISLVGLGLGIDYSLLLVTRWREERQRGRDNRGAVVAAMETAGHAVVMSGITVAIGLLALLLLPVPWIRTVGVGGALIPLVTVLATLTLTPAILIVVGPKLDWPRRRDDREIGPGWRGWTTLVVRRRWLAAALGVLLLAGATVPFLRAEFGVASAESLARSGPEQTTYERLKADGIPTGALTPIEVLVHSDAAARTSAVLAGVDGIWKVVTANGADPLLNRPLRGAGPQVTMVLAFPYEQTISGPSTTVVDRATDAVAGEDAVIGLTGLGPARADFQRAVYDNFGWVIAALSILIFLVLARAFRSPVLALKAVLMNIVSLSAAMGAMVLCWQWGIGSDLLYGLPATGAITVWVPILVFAFLFGLSMDYEVFILARIREAYLRTGDTDTAIVEGIGRTGRLVTCAALILFLSFAAMSTGPGTDLKIMATGLGLGILLDATIIRSLLLPATVSLFGRWNWYIPTRGHGRVPERTDREATLSTS
ncbi:MMPL family transporter [Nocardia alba]|uniref:RND superfamily putative drug exporter n=1 Tax=Nocardia alba TaxID=225051 RepID=A0A4R1G1Y6_9NOCA|nr:MMPL family transporter [Nocardia alba]TCJ97721.1 RND superfamily putative drug exporter [Nocardia alba]